jgi:hypothetical protein
MATFIKLLAIRIAASKDFGFSKSLKAFSFEFPSLRFLGLFPIEKKATSEAEIIPEKNNNISNTKNQGNSTQSKGCI